MSLGPIIYKHKTIDFLILRRYANSMHYQSRRRYHRLQLEEWKTNIKSSQNFQSIAMMKFQEAGNRKQEAGSRKQRESFPYLWKSQPVVSYLRCVLTP